MIHISVPSHYRYNTAKQQTVGGTSAQLSQLAAGDAVKGTPDNIFVQAAPGNSGTITIVNVNPAVSLGAGFILSANANINLPSKNPGEWYVVASASSQVLNIMYQQGPV